MYLKQSNSPPLSDGQVFALTNRPSKIKSQRPLPDGADPIVREPECEKLSGLSQTTRWRMERQGDFPPRIQLSKNAIGWRFSDIENWLAEREEG